MGACFGVGEAPRVNQKAPVGSVFVQRWLGTRDVPSGLYPLRVIRRTFLY